MASQSVIGFDLGGTKSSIGRFDAETGALLESRRYPTDASRGFLAVQKEMIDAIQTMRTPDTVAVGVGVPGLVRAADGVVLHTPNIPDGVDIPLLHILEQELKLPIVVENDANCFTFAEASHGAGKGLPVVVGITLGTGVGGGIVIDGRIFRGANGFAGEIGHMLLMPGQPPYKTKDLRGDVEQFLSGTAIGARCTDADTPTDYFNGEACAFLRPDLFKEVAWLCASLIHLLDPSVIVFGGSAGKALEKHLPVIAKELTTWVLSPMPVPLLRVAAADHPDMLGAALLALKVL